MLEAVKMRQSFNEAVDALLGTLWINVGHAMPSMVIHEQLLHNQLTLEVKRPASDRASDCNIVGFSFAINGITELSMYYDLAIAESKKAVYLFAEHVTRPVVYQEAMSLLMSYYKEVSSSN